GWLLECVQVIVFVDSAFTALFVFFFFQAEDGIRDDLVTGVQTCALPICSRCRAAGSSTASGRGGAEQRQALAAELSRGQRRRAASARRGTPVPAGKTGFGTRPGAALHRHREALARSGRITATFGFSTAAVGAARID